MARQVGLSQIARKRVARASEETGNKAALTTNRSHCMCRPFTIHMPLRCVRTNLEGGGNGQASRITGFDQDAGGNPSVWLELHCRKENMRTAEVYAALNFLAQRAGRKWPLEQFRNSLDYRASDGWEAEGRWQTVSASLNAIRLAIKESA